MQRIKMQRMRRCKSTSAALREEMIMSIVLPIFPLVEQSSTLLERGKEERFTSRDPLDIRYPHDILQRDRHIETEREMSRIESFYL